MAQTEQQESPNGIVVEVRESGWIYMDKVKHSGNSENIDPVEIRKRLKLSQKNFWEPLGVAQSTGCRYELGRAMPGPLVKLLNLFYSGGGFNFPAPSDEEKEILKYLECNPCLRKQLLKQSRSAVKKAPANRS